MKLDNKDVRPPDDPALVIKNALDQLEKLRQEFEIAESEERIASARTTRIRNDMNYAQKRIDEATKQLKEQAPWNTEWHSQRRRGKEAVANG